MTAGRRDNLIRLERATATPDPYGEEVQTWASLGQEWAAVFYGRGDERRKAAMEQGAQPATFQLLANDTTRALTIRDRISVDGAVWDIQGIAPDTPRRGLIELTAARGG